MSTVRVSDELVAALQEALRLAREGRIRSAVLFLGPPDGPISHRVAGDVDDDFMSRLCASMLGLSSLYSQRLVSGVECIPGQPARWFRAGLAPHSVWLPPPVGPQIPQRRQVDADPPLEVSVQGFGPADSPHTVVVESREDFERLAQEIADLPQRVGEPRFTFSMRDAGQVPQRRRFVTTDPAAGELPVEFRYGDPGETTLDEVLVRWPRHVHVEVMGCQHIWMGITLDDGRVVHCNFYLDLPEDLRDNGDDDFEPAVCLRYRAEVEPPPQPQPPPLVSRLAEALTEASARLPEGDPLRARADKLLQELRR